jgi:hypothetical protein
MAPMSDVCQLRKPRQCSRYSDLATSQKPGFDSWKGQRFLSSPRQPNQPPCRVNSPGLGEVRENGLDVKVGTHVSHCLSQDYVQPYLNSAHPLTLPKLRIRGAVSQLRILFHHIMLAYLLD